MMNLKSVAKTIKEKYGVDWYNLRGEFKEYSFNYKEEKIW
jgi:hypothetical protein